MENGDVGAPTPAFKIADRPFRLTRVLPADSRPDHQGRALLPSEAHVPRRRPLSRHAAGSLLRHARAARLGRPSSPPLLPRAAPPPSRRRFLEGS